MENRHVDVESNPLSTCNIVLEHNSRYLQFVVIACCSERVTFCSERGAKQLERITKALVLYHGFGFLNVSTEGPDVSTE